VRDNACLLDLFAVNNTNALFKKKEELDQEEKSLFSRNERKSYSRYEKEGRVLQGELVFSIRRG